MSWKWLLLIPVVLWLGLSSPFTVDATEYVYLTQFGPTTYRDLRLVTEKLNRLGMKGMVLDLRFNPGGLLGAALMICDMYVESGTLPALELVRYPHDHFGAFTSAYYRVDNPEKQMSESVGVLTHGGQVPRIQGIGVGRRGVAGVRGDKLRQGRDDVDRKLGLRLGQLQRVFVLPQRGSFGPQ